MDNNNSNLTGSMLDAVQTLINAIPAGTTIIKATVIECLDEAAGEYKVNYLHNKFSAFCNKNLVFAKDEEVYILVPDGDMTQTKIIISSVNPSATTDALIQEANRYSQISNNLCNLQNSYDGIPSYIYSDRIFKLCSYENVDYSGIRVCNDAEDLEIFKEYFQQYNSMKLSFYVRNNLDPDQRVQGNYGVTVSIPVRLKDKPEVKEIKTYTLDVNNMLGNPYHFDVDTEQSLILTIDEQFEYDNDNTAGPTISVFCKDFPLNGIEAINHRYQAGLGKAVLIDEDGNLYDSDAIRYFVDSEGTNLSDEYGNYVIDSSDDIAYLNKPNFEITDSIINRRPDIWIRDIGLASVKVLEEGDLTGFKLTVNATEGLYFMNDKYSKTKTLTPTLLVDGKEAKLTNANECWWFAEDPTVTVNDEEYLSYGGLGWRCLNDKEVAGTGDDGANIYQYNTRQREYQVNESDVLSTLRYKCVVLYNNEYVTGIVKIENKGGINNFKYSVTSDKSVYPRGIGKVRITADLTWEDEIPDGKVIVSDWRRYDQNGVLADETSNLFTLEDSETSDHRYKETVSYDVYLIDQANSIQCTLYLQGDFGKGEAKKIITSKTIRVSTSNELDYTINIIHDNVIYKYDADGDSPALDWYDGPPSSKVKTIVPLEFKMYHKDGQELTAEEYADCKVTWHCAGMVTAATYDKSIFNYNIANKYDKQKAHDTYILVDVFFDNSHITKYANVQFLKDGESGTNGTKYSALIGKTDSNGNFISYRQIDANGNEQKLRFLCEGNAKEDGTTEWIWKWSDIYGGNFYPFGNLHRAILQLKVYKDGIPLTSGYTTTWSMFDNNTGKIGYFSISNDGIIQPRAIGNNYNLIQDDPQCEIVQAKITITENGGASAVSKEPVVLYAYYPLEYIIATGEGYPTFPAVIGGFSTVLYNSAGENPEYDSTKPFECNFRINVSQEDKNSELQPYIVDWKSSNHLTQKDDNGKDTVSFIPDYKYDDSDSNNYVAVTVGHNKKQLEQLKSEYNTKMTNNQNTYNNYTTILNKFRTLAKESYPIELKHRKEIKVALNNFKKDLVKIDDKTKKEVIEEKYKPFTNYISVINSALSYIDKVDVYTYTEKVKDDKGEEKEEQKTRETTEREKNTYFKYVCNYFKKYFDTDKDGNFIINEDKTSHVLIESFEKKIQDVIDKADKEMSENKYKSETLQILIDKASFNIKYVRPIVLLFNRYEMGYANDWDGNKLVLGEDKGYLIAPQVLAGKKEEGSFTGVTMGIQNLNSTGVINSNNSKVGLFGYKKGVRSFFLDANSGGAFFGRSDTGGQIIIDPTQGAYLYSSNYWYSYNASGFPNYAEGTKYSKASDADKADTKKQWGLLIDLKTPEIKWGNEKFSVNANGALKSTSGQIGGWTIGNTTLTGGHLILNSNGSIYSNEHNELTNRSNGFFLNESGLSIGSKFEASSDGTLKVGNLTDTENNRYWTIDGSGTNSYIRYGNKTTYNDIGEGKTGVYIGTDGISLGSNFIVSNSGSLTAKDGTIGGWTISASNLSAGNITLKDEGSISGPGWNIDKNGVANFNNLHANTAGKIGGFTIGSSSLTGSGVTLGNGSISAGGVSLSPTGLNFGNGTIITNTGQVTNTAGTSTDMNKYNYLHIQKQIWIPSGFDGGKKAVLLGNGRAYGKTGSLTFSNGVMMTFNNGILTGIAGGGSDMVYQFD